MVMSVVSYHKMFFLDVVVQLLHFVATRVQGTDESFYQAACEIQESTNDSDARLSKEIAKVAVKRMEFF